MTGPVFAPVRLPLAWRWLGSWVWRLEHAFERARAAASPHDSRRRIALVMIAFGLAFFVMGIGATHQALFSGNSAEFSGASASPYARAALTDRNGALLAVDLPHYQLYVDPREVWDVQGTQQALAAILPQAQAKRLNKALTGTKRAFVIGGLTPDQRTAIHDLGLPGLSFEDDERRVYPLGNTASHLIGFSDSAGSGLAGAEKALDADVRKAAVTGGSVPLSLDLRVQAALEDELRKAANQFTVRGAVGLITDVHTGEILALASYPDFDPNNAGAADPNALVNRVAQSVFEMGSTFKIFTVAQGLDSGTVRLNSTFDVSHPLTIGTQTIHDYDKGDTTLDLPHVLLHSSNIAAAKIALAMGADTVTGYYRNLGLFGSAPVELAESARPLLPQKWSQNVLASASFGNAIAVSPLAVAAGTAAVANGGTYVPLTIRKVEPGHEPKGRRVFSPQTSQTMLRLLRMNVLEGTGGKADAPGFSVGGKTGSNEKVVAGRIDRNKLVSSFAAVFPADGPPEAKRYFLLVLMDEPHATKETYGFATGGWTAAPAAGRIVSRVGPLLGLKRAPVAATDKATVEAALASGEDH
ncbi:MAG: penicillin-binding protein 2 [Alphaproteobacteria bacterium]|jgi:cell division protein FtsI (penicillin-binding protein 3)